MIENNILHADKCECRECLEKWCDLLILKIIADNPEDEKIAEQMTQLLRHSIINGVEE